MCPCMIRQEQFCDYYMSLHDQSGAVMWLFIMCLCIISQEQFCDYLLCVPAWSVRSSSVTIYYVSMHDQSGAVLWLFIMCPCMISQEAVLWLFIMCSCMISQEQFCDYLLCVPAWSLRSSSVTIYVSLHDQSGAIMWLFIIMSLHDQAGRRTVTI